MTPTGRISLARRAWIAIALMTGFYGIVAGLSGGLFALAYVLLTRFTDEWHEELAGLCAGVAFGLLVTAFPSIFRLRRPGARLDAKSHPELFERIAKLARVAGQEMPAKVLLTAEANAWVAPLGGVMGIRSKWVLGLGLPLMQTLTISEFEAALAHEFGHFHGGDTKLIPMVCKTRAAIARTTGMFPGFQWYGRMFLRITEKIGRAQEFTADRLAANTAGSDALIEVLHAVPRIASAAMDYFDWDVRPIAKAGFIPPVAEGFAAKLSRPSVITSMDEALREELAKSEPDPHDSHPPLSQRIAALEPLPRCENPDTASALSLLRDLPSLEHELIASMLGLKNEKLKPIAWADVGVSVWMPMWEQAAKRWPESLKGRTLQDLSDLASDKLSPSARHVLGAAFACSLDRAGWTLESGPGIRSFNKGPVKLDPFQTVTQIASGDLTREQWNTQVDALGLDPSMPLLQMK